MNTSSFLCGVLMGAAASMIMSKKRQALLSSLSQASGSINGSGDKAKDKILGMALTGFGNTAASANRTQGEEGTSNSNIGAAAAEHKDESPVKSKESNLKMLKDFIRSNPDVKHEVEQILKETHTAIPGL